MATHRRPEGLWETPFPFYQGNPVSDAPRGCCGCLDCSKEDPRQFQTAWHPPPPPPRFPVQVQGPEWSEEYHWRARGVVPFAYGVRLFHQGEMQAPGQGYEALGRVDAQSMGDIRRHHIRGNTEPIVEPERSKRWTKPKRRVKSVDQSDAQRPGQAQHLQQARAPRQPQREPAVRPGEGLFWRAVNDAAASRRVAVPNLEAPGCREVGPRKFQPAEEPATSATSRQEQTSPSSGHRSPSEESHLCQPAPHVKNGTEDKAAQVSTGNELSGATDLEEMQRLKQLAEEYAKVKEENDKLQEDLSKSKRLNKNLRKENRRLFRKQNSANDLQAATQAANSAATPAATPVATPVATSQDDDDDPLQKHVIQQLQNLQVEKAKLVQENCQLTRDNQSLHELLQYALGAQDDSDPGSDEESSCENENYDYQNNHRGRLDNRDECKKSGSAPDLFDPKCSSGGCASYAVNS